MNSNEFSQAQSEFAHVVQMVRNHIAEEHFISKFVISVSNSHERLREAIPKNGTGFDVKCQIWLQTRFIQMLQSSSCISQTIFYRTQIDVKEVLMINWTGEGTKMGYPQRDFASEIEKSLHSRPVMFFRRSLRCHRSVGHVVWLQ